MSLKPLTIRFNSRYRDEMDTLEKLKEIRENRRCSYSRIITDLMNSQRENSTSLSVDDVTRIAESAASIVLEKLQLVLPGYLSASMNGKSNLAPGNDNAVRENDEPSDSQLPADESDSDFSDSSIDFGFLGI